MTIGQYTPEEPISSIATALAPAALGIIRVSGKNCIDLVANVFSRPKALKEAAGNTLVYGWIVEPIKNSECGMRNDGAAVNGSGRGLSVSAAVNSSDRGLSASAAVNSSDGQLTDVAAVNARNGQLTDATSVTPRDVKLKNSTAVNDRRRIDEVMCAVYRAPKSFTGEDMVEIFCHGGPSVVTAIQNLMLQSGFRQALRGEYTFRAYINGKTDLTKAEAVKEIIDSHTDASRSHAAGRLAGSLFTEIDSIKKLIIDTLAAIEVEIEYPEDEETIADTFDRADIEEAIRRLQDLVDSWKGEKLYQDGARVVLAGRTNAGKSSLFNTILKEERAIVSDIEGTTRDWLESWASINGIPVRIFDTAGLRETEDVIEAHGVELTRNLAKDSDLVLYLIDSTHEPTEDDYTFIENCREPLIVVWTKADLGNTKTTNPRLSERKSVVSDSERTTPSAGFKEVAFATIKEARIACFNNLPQVRLSSKTGNGLAELFAQITKILTAGITTDREQAGLGSQRQKEAVAEALEFTKHALVSADDNYTLDAVVQDLEDALDSLGEVTGDVTPDDVLGSIFANFCVGK